MIRFLENVRRAIRPSRLLLLSGIAISLCLSLGCSPPPVPDDLVEKLTLAAFTFDHDCLRYYYHMEGPLPGSPDLTRLPEEEIRLLKEMYEPAHRSAISYRDHRATVLVDIGHTGMIEWFNVNKLRVRPDYDLRERQYVVLYMEYRHGSWALSGYALFTPYTVPVGWPDAPELPDGNED